MSSPSLGLRPLVRFESESHGPVTIDGAVCENEGCLCDTISLQIETEGQRETMELTSAGDLIDKDFKVAEKRWWDIVGEAWQLPELQENFEELVAQRRRLVLEEAGRLGPPFEVRVPEDWLGEGAIPSEGILGTFELEGGRYEYKLELCSTEGCECENLFLIVRKPGETGVSVFGIESSGLWFQQERGRPEIDMDVVEARLMQEEAFVALVGWLRMERILQKYHRFLATTGRL